jgi:hypothetical protein
MEALVGALLAAHVRSVIKHQKAIFEDTRETEKPLFFEDPFSKKLSTRVEPEELGGRRAEDKNAVFLCPDGRYLVRKFAGLARPCQIARKLPSGENL